MGTAGLPVPALLSSLLASSQKHAPSPHDRDNPQASPRPEGRQAYGQAQKPANNYESRTAEMKSHRESLSEPRTDR
jgi:hypothetical protein